MPVKAAPVADGDALARVVADVASPHVLLRRVGLRVSG
jgi:hypothetical protein